MKKITFLVVLALMLSLSTLVACGGGGGGGGATNTAVTMGGTSFDQTSVTITKGSTITFTNDQGSPTHNLVNGSNGKASPESGAPDFGSGQLVSGSGKTWTTPPWNTAGTFHVTCTFHPNTMTMTVTVTG